MVRINDYLIKDENDGYNCYHLFKGVALPFAVFDSLGSAILMVIQILNIRHK